jgi:alkaline phosphatase
MTLLTFAAADVNIYTSDKVAAAALIGNHENTDVGNFLRDYLEVDIDQITRELVARGPQFSTVENGAKMSWLGPVGDGQRLDGQDHIDHYQGDFKKHKRCEICG